MQKLSLFVIIILFALTSCSQSGKRYKIGVSQCSVDIWREKQNAELRMGAYFHDNVELRFAAAYDSDERQVGKNVSETELAANPRPPRAGYRIRP